MSKKKHKKHDEFDLSLEERLRRIYDGYNPEEEREPTSPVTELINKVAGQFIFQDSEDDSNAIPEVSEIPSSIKQLCQETTDDTIDSLSVIAPKGVCDEINRVFDTLGEEESNDGDDDMTLLDPHVPTMPEVYLEVISGCNIVRFSDRFNTVTINLNSIVNDSRNRRKIPKEKLSSLVKNVIDACIATTIPAKIMSKTEFVELKSMIGRLDPRAYAFRETGMIFDSDKDVCIYKLEPNFYDNLKGVIEMTEKTDTTALFLNALQEACYSQYHVWNTSRDFFSVMRDQLGAMYKVDFIWDVFFATDGVDPISSNGKHDDVSTIEKKIKDATFAPGMLWDPLLDFGDEDDEYSEDDEDDEDDDPNDDSNEEAEEVSSTKSEKSDETEESVDDLAAALEESLESDSENESGDIPTDSKPDDGSVSTSVVINVASDSNSGLEAEELVFDVVRRKDN